MKHTCYIVVALLVVSISFYSCNNKKENVFYGNIIDVISGLPVADVDILIEMREVSSYGAVAAYETIGNTVSDSEGNFRFSCDAARAVNFRLSFSKQGYFTKTLIITPVDVIGEYQASTAMGMVSHLMFTIQNVAPFSNDDVLRYRLSGLANGCDDCCDDALHSFYGAADTLTICPIVAYNNITIEYFTFINGVSSQFTQQITGEPGDTVKIVMRY